MFTITSLRSTHWLRNSICRCQPTSRQMPAGCCARYFEARCAGTYLRAPVSRASTLPPPRTKSVRPHVRARPREGVGPHCEDHPNFKSGGVAMRSIRCSLTVGITPCKAHRPTPTRRLLICAATTVVVSSSVVPLGAAADEHEQGTHVELWAVGHVGVLPAVTAQYSNQTLREIVHTSVGGDEVR